MSRQVAYVPERGDLVWLQFDPQVDHEQAERRPAFIISPKTYNDKVGLAILCPITSHVKGYPFEVNLPNHLLVHGVVLADQVKNLDWQVRQATFICKSPQNVIDEVLMKLEPLMR